MDWNKMGAIGSLGSCLFAILLFGAQVWPYPQWKAAHSQTVQSQQSPATSQNTTLKVPKSVVGFVIASFLLSSLSLFGAWKKPWKSPKGNKLVIHSALFGTGPADDVSVLEKLNATPRDALVIPADNSLVPQDPAPNKVKRLHVEYSYGNSAISKATRQEGGRLVLPEDIDPSFHNPQWELVPGRTFRNTTVKVDGKRFYNCKFINVTFQFDGSGPTEFLGNCEVGGSVGAETEHPVARAYSHLFEMLSKISNPSGVGFSALNEKGHTRPSTVEVQEIASPLRQASALTRIPEHRELELEEHDPKVYLEPLNGEFLTTGMLPFEISNRGQRVNVAHKIIIQPITLVPALSFEYVDHLDMAERKKLLPKIANQNPFSATDFLHEMERVWDARGQQEEEFPFEIKIRYEDVTGLKKFQSTVKMAYCPVEAMKARRHALNPPPRTEYQIIKLAGTSIKRLG
jgi:hypothetical protein